MPLQTVKRSIAPGRSNASRPPTAQSLVRFHPVAAPDDDRRGSFAMQLGMCVAFCMLAWAFLTLAIAGVLA